MIIVFEGLDAAGKRTQSSLLADTLRERRSSVATMSFPRYHETFYGESVSDYLNGKFGALDQVAPHLAAILYAGDRLESRAEIIEQAASNDFLLLDRYVSSNAAYQAAKVPTFQRREFISWVERLEYGVHQLPDVNVTVLLDIPAETAGKMVFRKGERSYTKEPADLHERDIEYLARCADVYHELAQTQFRSTWVTVQCVTTSGRLRPRRQIANDVLRQLEATEAFQRRPRQLTLHEAEGTVPRRRSA